MFIFKKANHLGRRHYTSKPKNVEKHEEKTIEVRIKPELKEVPVVIAKENPFTDAPETKKTRAAKKTAVVEEATVETKEE